MGRLSYKLKTQLSQDYFQYNFQNIGEYSKLRTYVKFKLNSKREDYLDIQDISLKHRKLCRIGKICNIQTETEEHFMLFCPKFRK